MPRPFTIALGQLAAREDKKSTLAAAVDFVRQAGEQGANLIIFAEIGMTKFFPQYRADGTWLEQAERIPGGMTCQAMQEAAAKYKVGVVVSIYESPLDGVYYDSAAVIDTDGTCLGTQRMMHIAEEPLYNEKFYYKPGNTFDYPVFTMAGNIKVGVAICQDQFFPEQLRILALHGAELIAVPTAVSAETDPMMIASQSGAVLNQVFFAIANRVGPEDEMEFIGKSHVFAPDGELAGISKVKGDDLVLVPVDMDYVGEVRRRQNYWLRDRRPETYGDLVKPVF
jgi:beta-ureidopropionase